MANELELRVTVGKQKMPVSQNAQLQYVFVEATPVPTLAAEPMPLNFCFVLDHSGSMDGPKLTNVKAAVKLLVERMRPSDLVSVVVFDDNAAVPVPSQAASNLDAIKQAVDKIREGGGTAISQGLKLGLDELRKGIAPDRVSRLLLLTDGQTWGDEPACQQLADEASKLNIPITALGVGEEWNEKLLDVLAEKTSGVSDFIDTPDKIVPFFEQALKRAQSTVVTNATLTMRLVSGVTPRAVHRVRPAIMNLGTKPLSDRFVTVAMGDLDAAGTALLVELSVPARPAGPYRMAQTEIEYSVPGQGGGVEKVRADVIVTFTNEPTEADAIDPNVMNLAEKVSAFKLQTRAFSEAEAGNIPGATQKLRNAATRLLNLGEAELAQAAQQEADNLEQQGTMSAGGTKRLNYNTRRLTANDLTAAETLAAAAVAAEQNVSLPAPEPTSPAPAPSDAAMPTAGVASSSVETATSEIEAVPAAATPAESVPEVEPLEMPQPEPAVSEPPQEVKPT